MSSSWKSPSPDNPRRSPTRTPEAPGNPADGAVDNHIEVVCSPNDDRQQDAADLMHEMYRIVLDGNLYEAPISDTPQFSIWATKSDDGSLKPTSPLYKWVDVFEKIGELTGKTFFYGDKAADAMKEAGLSGVIERRLKLPLGPWPKDKKLRSWGAWNRQFLLQALEGFSIRGLTEMLGWSFNDAQLFLMDMRNELLNPSVHAYGEVTIIYGQKLENET
ncbi:hypothetical protein B0J13DRAFT_603046 [Dactylonectria estremocensis]|uniref:Uncharacterized protein n=1 Tax=Dactylonectria estremocensis TaxID=1079267 RepID=A0A9P9JAT7_9HYPO|nr:hypothetical protein B0J13DRAFT_603046 [Dactylonectria estremocensis]